MSVCFELPQESENALAIKLREQVLKKLSECKNEEELKRTLVSILSENDSQLDLEKIQSGNETLSRLENFLVCSLTEPSDNLTETQIQLGELLKNAVELICDPPELSIPYPYPVFDLSGDFLKKLLAALLRLAIKILFSILKKILSLLIDICNSGLSSLNGFGLTNISNIISESVGGEISASFIGQVFNSFGINTDGTTATAEILDGESCDDNSGLSAIKNVQNFLDDLSFMLTPVEVCSLLNGKANDVTFQVVEELLIFEYPSIRNRINSRSKIEDLFITLGSRNDPSICELIENNAETIISNPELCFSSDVEGLRRRILEDKNIPEEEIKNQLEKERERNKANLQKISELAAAVRTNPDRIFGEPPNVMCKQGSPGLFGIDDMPYFKEALTDAIGSIFDPFFISYTRSSETFPDYVIDSEEKPINNPKVIKKFITVTATTEDGDTQIIENSTNTKFMQKISAGQYTICDQFGNVDRASIESAYEDTKVNGVEVFQDSILDVQTLVNSAYNSLEDAPRDNIYILNTELKQNVLFDIVENIYPNIDNYFDMNIDELSLSLNVPTKYTPIRKTNEPADFTSIQSNELLVLKTKAR